MTTDYNWMDILETPTKLFKGRFFQSVEGPNIEIKGSKDSGTPMDEQAMLNSAKDNGQTVCAFLNTHGGSLFYGIHAKTRVIQGVRVKQSPGKAILKLGEILYHRLDSLTLAHLVKIIAHPVYYFSTRNPGVVQRPTMMADVAYLDVERLTEPTTEPANEDLFVFEVRARKSPNLVLWDGRGFQRSTSTTTRMTLEQLRKAIVAPR